VHRADARPKSLPMARYLRAPSRTPSRSTHFSFVHVPSVSVIATGPVPRTSTILDRRAALTASCPPLTSEKRQIRIDSRQQ